MTGAPMKLYAAFLGGDFELERMGEDHEVVFVVAENPAAAKAAAKAKWQGHGRAHVDALRQIDRIDGFDVTLVPGDPGDRTRLDQTYEPADPQ